MHQSHEARARRVDLGNDLLLLGTALAEGPVALVQSAGPLAIADGTAFRVNAFCVLVGSQSSGQVASQGQDLPVVKLRNIAALFQPIVKEGCVFEQGKPVFITVAIDDQLPGRFWIHGLRAF